jgi:hypothetical protein
MSTPYRPGGSADEPTVSFGGGAADDTQAVRPSSGGYGAGSPPPDLRKLDRDDPDLGAPSVPSSTRSDDRPDPFSAPMPAVTPEPAYGADRSSSWSAEPDDSRSAGPSVTSVYPQSTPEYAPAGYPAAYAPTTVVPPPTSSQVPEKPSSRVGPGFLSAILGLILTAGGLYLLVRFGYRAGLSLTKGDVSIRNSGLGLLGALLLFVATILNGWSFWSTLLPGIALTGLGGWALFDANAYGRIGGWVRSIFDGNDLTNALVTGFLLSLGLVLLGASLAALLARSGGKRDGRILGRRAAAAEDRQA